MYTLANERSGLTLTLVIDTNLPWANSLPLLRKMSASSFCIKRDTFFCLVDSMASYYLIGKGNKKGTTAQRHKGLTGKMINDSNFYVNG